VSLLPPERGRDDRADRRAGRAERLEGDVDGGAAGAVGGDETHMRRQRAVRGGIEGQSDLEGRGRAAADSGSVERAVVGVGRIVQGDLRTDAGSHSDDV
jgi:hypothetical protein